jgi:hypothetical protein
MLSNIVIHSVYSLVIIKTRELQRDLSFRPQRY